MNAGTVQQVVYAVMLAIVAGVSLVAHLRGYSKLANLADSAIKAIPPRGGGAGQPAAASSSGPVPERADVRPWLTTASVPLYGQLTQTLPTVDSTATWYNDCGETVCSMIVRAARGVYVPPDELRVLLRGQSGNPLTNTDDLTAILAFCHIRAHPTAAGAQTAIAEMRAATEDGRPVCALGTWPTPGGVLHWLLVTRVNGERIYYHNPWGPASSWLLIADWAQYTANAYVIVDSHLLYP